MRQKKVSPVEIKQKSSTNGKAEISEKSCAKIEQPEEENQASKKADVGCEIQEQNSEKEGIKRRSRRKHIEESEDEEIDI